MARINLILEKLASHPEEIDSSVEEIKQLLEESNDKVEFNSLVRTVVERTCSAGPGSIYLSAIKRLASLGVAYEGECRGAKRVYKFDVSVARSVSRINPLSETREVFRKTLLVIQDMIVAQIFPWITLKQIANNIKIVDETSVDYLGELVVASVQVYGTGIIKNGSAFRNNWQSVVARILEFYQPKAAMENANISSEVESAFAFMKDVDPSRKLPSSSVITEKPQEPAAKSVQAGSDKSRKRSHPSEPQQSEKKLELTYYGPYNKKPTTQQPNLPKTLLRLGVPINNTQPPENFPQALLPLPIVSGRSTQLSAVGSNSDSIRNAEGKRYQPATNAYVDGAVKVDESISLARLNSITNNLSRVTPYPRNKTKSSGDDNKIRAFISTILQGTNNDKVWELRRWLHAGVRPDHFAQVINLLMLEIFNRLNTEEDLAEYSKICSCLCSFDFVVGKNVVVELQNACTNYLTADWEMEYEKTQLLLDKSTKGPMEFASRLDARQVIFRTHRSGCLKLIGRLFAEGQFGIKFMLSLAETLLNVGTESSFDHMLELFTILGTDLPAAISESDLESWWDEFFGKLANLRERYSTPIQIKQRLEAIFLLKDQLPIVGVELKVSCLLAKLSPGCDNTKPLSRLRSLVEQKCDNGHMCYLFVNKIESLLQDNRSLQTPLPS